MAMTAKTKAERIARLEARIEKIRKSATEATARIRSLDEDRDAAVRELEWLKGAPTADGGDQLTMPVEVERVAVPAASPFENAGVAEVATSTQHL